MKPSMGFIAQRLSLTVGIGDRTGLRNAHQFLCCSVNPGLVLFGDATTGLFVPSGASVDPALEDRDFRVGELRAERHRWLVFADDAPVQRAGILRRPARSKDPTSHRPLVRLHGCSNPMPITSAQAYDRKGNCAAKWELRRAKKATWF